MWTYQVPTGRLHHNGTLVGIGYSGHGESINNPEDDHIHDMGPIPRGQWEIGPFFDDPGGKGPLVAHLSPVDATETHGRTGFMFHGNNGHGDRSASHGCVILARVFRENIAESGDIELLVTG